MAYAYECRSEFNAVLCGMLISIFFECAVVVGVTILSLHNSTTRTQRRLPVTQSFTQKQLSVTIAFACNSELQATVFVSVWCCLACSVNLFARFMSSTLFGKVDTDLSNYLIVTTVKSQNFVGTYFRTFEKSTKFNTVWNFFLVWPCQFSVSFCFEAVESTKITLSETVTCQNYEDGYRTKIWDFTVLSAETIFCDFFVILIKSQNEVPTKLLPPKYM